MYTPKLTRKIIISGNVIEVFEYYLPEIQPIRHKKEHFDSGEDSDPNPQSAVSAIKRAKTKLARLVSANAWKWKDDRGVLIPPRFLTLTFGANILDLKIANYKFTKFIQRLNYELYGVKKAILQYVAVPEFTKKGRVHFHVIIFNMSFIDRVYDILNSVWKEGFMNFKTIDRVKKVSKYVVKYMSKSADDPRLTRHKKYFPSRGLKTPLILRDDVAIELLTRSLPHSFLKFTGVFPSGFLGDIHYKRFELDQKATLDSLKVDEYVKSCINESIE